MLASSASHSSLSSNSACVDLSALTALRQQALTLIDQKVVPLKTIYDLSKFINVAGQDLLPHLVERDLQPQDTSELAYGHYRYIDRQIISEVLLRAAQLPEQKILRVLELGGGPTVPRHDDIGAPHLARAFAQLLGSRAEIHMVEGGTHNGDCLPDLEKTLFGLYVHTMGWDDLKAESGQDNFDVIFARHLFPPYKEKECLDVIAVANQLLAPGGAMIIAFDIQNTGVAGELNKYYQYEAGNLHYRRNEFAKACDNIRGALYREPGHFESSWIELLPQESEELKLQAEHEVDRLVLIHAREPNLIPNRLRREFELAVSVQLDISFYSAQESVRRLLGKSLLLVRQPDNRIEARKLEP